MNTLNELWRKLAASKEYREEFVTAQVKRGIPFQIATLLKRLEIPQAELAARSGLTQGVVSRAANPNYGNLTLNTLIRIAAGFDVAFVGRFVPFSELGRWFIDLSEDSVDVRPFEKENEEPGERLSESGGAVNIVDFRARKRKISCSGQKLKRKKGSILRKQPGHAMQAEFRGSNGNVGWTRPTPEAING